MRPAWRLATSSVFERPSRTLLLVGVVAMAAMLIAAVGVALGSVRAAIDGRVKAVVGAGDVRIKPAGGGRTFDASAVALAKSWPGVQLASERLVGQLALRFARPYWEKQEGEGEAFKRGTRVFTVSAIGHGIDSVTETKVRPITLVKGRFAERDDEIVLDLELAKRLSRPGKTGPTFRAAGAALMGLGQKVDSMKEAKGPEVALDAKEAQRLNLEHDVAVGDSIEFMRFGEEPLRLNVVGLAAQPPLGGTFMGYMTTSGLARAAGLEGRLSQVDLILNDGEDPTAFVERRRAELPANVLVQTTEKVTSGLDQNMQANQLGFVLVSLMSFICAGFIIMTGMSTSVAERQRELAILRCIGASKGQLALAQIFVGLMIGALGAAVGVPLGATAAAFLVEHYREKLGAPVTIDAWRLVLAGGGAMFAGVVGGLIPAWQASRVTPLSALAVRARPARRRTIAILTLAGFMGVAIHLCLFLFATDGDTLFFLYISLGLPCVMLGYFLLGVPTVLLIARVFGGVVARVLGLPSRLLKRSIEATPYRFGFTSGAMMAGLALMVGIWTQGGAGIRDWIDRIKFPDAFVVGLNLSKESEARLRELPFVTDTSPVAMHAVETDAFGVKKLTRLKTFFIAFEPESFFRMSRLDWVQGDPATAARRIKEGGAVIVAREFLIARGLGVGGTFRCWDDGKEHQFEIVGVVTSPGLEIISDFFDVGDEFTDQRVHAVFGGRKDLKEKFGSENVGMIQVSLAPDVDDEFALQQMREKLLSAGVLNAGSGRQIKREILGFVRTTLVVSSAVAIFAMVTAGLGVANLIVAGIQARQFEFGVLRAVGAQRGLLSRLVLGEALVVALSSCVLGTLLGIQGAFGGVTLNRLIWGMDIPLKPPPDAIGVGWSIVIAMTLAAALPSVISLSRKRPRDLLGAMKG